MDSIYMYAIHCYMLLFLLFHYHYSLANDKRYRQTKHSYSIEVKDDREYSLHLYTLQTI